MLYRPHRDFSLEAYFREGQVDNRPTDKGFNLYNVSIRDFRSPTLDEEVLNLIAL